MRHPLLYELIYASRANSNFNSEVLDDILAISHTNNTKNNVTGLLIFDGTTFCQILEGEKATLDKTYERIMKDDRHIDHTLFHSGEIEKRSFSRWAMSFKRVNAALNTENWTDWMSAQQLISDVSNDNTAGRLILKLVSGIDPLNEDNPLGLSFV